MKYSGGKKWNTERKLGSARVTDPGNDWWGGRIFEGPSTAILIPFIYVFLSGSPATRCDVSPNDFPQTKDVYKKYEFKMMRSLGVYKGLEPLFCGRNLVIFHSLKDTRKYTRKLK